jgi:carboxylesterase
MTDKIYRSPQPFHWEGEGERGRTAIMLIHGFTGSPSEFRRFGYVLHDFGYTVNAVCLPGHGTKPEDMLGLRWPDWYGHVLDEYDRLRRGAYRRIIAVGHSMGGLLALKLGTDQHLDGIVSLASPIYLRNRKTWLAYPLQYVMRYIHKKPSVSRYEEVIAYDRSPLSCVASLRGLMRHVAKLLPQMKAPLFVGQGERDRTVLPSSASFVYEQAGSRRKRMAWYPETSHTMLMDADREALYEDILRFVQEVERDRWQAADEGRAGPGRH